MSTQSPEDAKRQQSVIPAIIHQKKQKHLLPYNETTEQLPSSGDETPELILHMHTDYKSSLINCEAQVLLQV